MQVILLRHMHALCTCSKSRALAVSSLLSVKVQSMLYMKLPWLWHIMMIRMLSMWPSGHEAPIPLRLASMSKCI